MPLQPARVALVVENKDTFRSACVVNAEAPAYAAVIFGEGNAFPKRVADLRNLAEERPFDEVHYFGDIDGEGFSIAAAAEQAVLSLGGFSFRLATSLYRALRAVGRPAGRFGRTSGAGRAIPLRYGLEAMDAESLGGRRIPQEALARPALREDLFPKCLQPSHTLLRLWSNVAPRAAPLAGVMQGE